MSSSAGGANIHVDRPVATAFDEPTRWFAQDAKLRVENFGVVACEPTQPVEVGRHFFVVVEDPGDVDIGLSELNSKFELHGNARFHVDGSAADEHLVTIARFSSHGQVVVDGNGVDVPGNQHAMGLVVTRATEMCARNDRVTIAQHGQVTCADQRFLDCVGECVFVPRHRLDVAEVFGNARDVTRQVESRRGHASSLGASNLVTMSATAHNAAWGHGLATLTADGTVLDTWFPAPALGARPAAEAEWAIPAHLTDLIGADARRRVTVTPVTIEVDLTSAPVGASDAYLRLHLLSHLLVAPNSINLEGIFGQLENVVWTNAGPVHPADFDELRPTLLRAGIQAQSVDRFPRLTDYVTPERVRIADASRVRLGAHLAPGTVVMHEGFVNFNAGTLGASMVEGRISQGVVVGDGSDIGGGASIMGTLSGGGTQRVSIGERSLLGANSGLGISLGNDCVVEAGLYVTAGTKVSYLDAEGHKTAKAVEFSGADNLLFRRNSTTGAVEVISRSGAGVTLNSALH